jgi:Tol biopolymer transport system component
MKRFIAILCCVFSVLIFGCSPALPSATPTLPPTSTPAPPTLTSSPTPLPTSTPIPPTPTVTETPTPTPTITPLTTLPSYDYSGLPGWLAYMDFDCSKMICTNVSIIRPDMSRRTLLTDHVHGLSPYIYWAPDAKSLALIFMGLGETGHEDLRLVTLSNKFEKVIYSVPQGVDLQDLGWSPDGRYLTFTESDQGDTVSQIKRLDVLTLQVVSLSADPKLKEGNATWSPDGKLIAFTSNRFDPGQNKRKIWTMAANGSNATIITPNDSYSSSEESNPSWSPDGQEIAFFRYIENDSKEPAQSKPLSGIWVMHPDGSTPMQVIDCQSPYGASPVWSPDGRRLAATCGEEGQGHADVLTDEYINTDVLIYDFENQAYIKANEVHDDNHSLSWSPDSRALIFLEHAAVIKNILHMIQFEPTGAYQNSAEVDFENPVWSPK